MRLARSLIRLSVFIGLALFVADCAFGQVVIQERVEVDPAVAVEGPTSNMGALPGWQFNMPGRLVVDFNVIATDGLHCGSPLSIWNPRFEFRYSGSRDTVITVPLVPYIVNELNPPTSCDLWLIEFEGGFDLGLVADGDRVEPLYLVHGFEVPLITEVLVPDDVQDNGDGTYLWYARNYISTEDNEPYFDHLYETLDYVVLLEQVLDHLFVLADPDTLAVDEAAVLNVEGRQADETPVGLPAGATLDLNLDQGGGTVGFLRWNGVDDVVLTGVPAADIEAGLVEIVASETGPPALTGEAGADAFRQRHRFSDGREPAVNNMAGETTLTVTATLSNDPTITGSATVTVSVETPTLELAFALNGSPIDPASYLPTKDDIIEVTATLVDGPPDATGDVIFTLPQAHEFEFDGTGGSGPETVTLQNGVATISVKSLAWWGVATVQADYDLNGQPLMAEQQIPIDSDGDTIADYWEDANGGRSLGGNPDDRDWDEEGGPGVPGDNVTKLDEYQGLLIGSDHRRLKANAREVLVNWANLPVAERQAAEEAFAALAVEHVDYTANAQNTLPLWVAGSASRMRRLIFLYQSRAPQPRIVTATNNSLYYFGGVAPQPQGFPLYDQKLITMGVYIYRDAIDQFYEGDRYYEYPPGLQAGDVREVKYAGIAGLQGLEAWTSEFNNSEIDGNGVPSTVRVWDLLSPVGSSNDVYDHVIAGHPHQTFSELVTIHEVGHAVGIRPEGTDGHMQQGASVMRVGIGPAVIRLFSANDDLTRVDMGIDETDMIGEP